MKGLLIKDYKLIMHNKRLFLVLMIVWLLVFQKYNGYSFLIGYSTMIFVLLVINTMSMDEYYKSTPYLITMPVSRNTYVTEKYILMLGFSLTGAVLSTVLCIVIHTDLLQRLIIESIAIYIILALFQLFMLPIQLKFGGDKGRIALIGLLSCVTVIATSMDKILPGLFGIQGGIGAIAQNAVLWFFGLPAVIKAVNVTVVCAVCFAVSYGASLHIMQKKEF